MRKPQPQRGVTIGREAGAGAHLRHGLRRVETEVPARRVARTDDETWRRATTITEDARISRDGHENNLCQGQLRSLVERIERLEEEKRALAGDIKEVYGEAKANGFDTKILRKVLTIRRKDRDEREEEQAMLDLYLGALGMEGLNSGW